MVKGKLRCTSYCSCINVGLTNKETTGLEERAIAQGASKIYVEDVQEELITDYIYPMVKAGCVYEDKYLLGTSIARPLIAKKLVDIALKEGADAICHGATGKGNDQIRFELGIKALAPHLKIIAAWRDDKWTLQSREDEIQYLVDRGIEVPMKKEDSYSRDANLWHISHEGLDLENPANEPKFDSLCESLVYLQNKLQMRLLMLKSVLKGYSLLLMAKLSTHLN